jgi:recombination protein RecT
MSDTTANVPAKQSPAMQLRNEIERRTGEFKAALPAHVPTDKFKRVVLTAVSMNPDLIGADRQSLMSACMRAAQDGLVLDGREAALVVYKVKQRDGNYKPVCTYIPMVAGLMKKARNSGEIASLSAQVVYEKDTFHYTLGDAESISHQPALAGDRGKPLAVYAIARLKDGSIQREVMSIAEVERIRSRSRAKDSGPWVSDWSEMARKTAIRRLCKYLPSSSDRSDGSDLIDVAARDDEMYEPETPAGEVATEAKPARARRAADKLNAQPATQAPEIDGEATDVTDTGTAGGEDMPPFLDRSQQRDVI